MKTGGRQLLNIILLFSLAGVSLGVEGSAAPAAVLHANGNVQVNGAGSRETTTVFPGDSIQTDADSVANIIAGGSSVLVMPNASVKFLGNMVELTDGGVAIVTSVGMAAKVDDLTITPATQEISKFEVAEDEDSVVVAARQGDLTVSDGQETSKVPEGQETTRKKKKRGGAIPAANGTHAISGKTLAIVGGAAGATVAGILIADDDKKKCVSPSGNKKCKCKKDKKGKEVCEIG